MKLEVFSRPLLARSNSSLSCPYNLPPPTEVWVTMSAGLCYGPGVVEVVQRTYTLVVCSSIVLHILLHLCITYAALSCSCDARLISLCAWYTLCTYCTAAMQSSRGVQTCICGLYAYPVKDSWVIIHLYMCIRSRSHSQ